MRKFAVGLAGVVLVSCGVFGASDEEATAPPPDSTPGPAAPPEENAKPPVDGTPLDGVFVSSSRGFEDGDGSPSRPVKTLASGLALGKKVGKRVIVCAETYAEAVDLVDGVSAYGYFDCSVSPWKKVERRARFESPTSPAITARKLTLPSRIEGFEFVAPDRKGPITDPRAASSIGLYVRESNGLTFENVLVHAGLGADGADGAEPTPNVQSGAIDGKPGVSQTVCTSNFCNLVDRQSGGAGGTSACAVGGNGGPGGQGGDGRWYNPNPVSANNFTTSGRPGTASAATNAGGPPVSAGKGGAHGDDGPDGANGAWTLDAEGFLPGDGTAGSNGAPGQGGGGGGGNENYICPNGLPCSPGEYFGAASGSGGGAGGCAGLAGTPGTGGGASIAAQIVDSDVTFSNAKLEATRGGRGGKGSLGTAGLAGGGGGTKADRGGSGGPGGAGGAGGLSGHGAPGPSIALAFKGKRPTTTGGELAPGEPATGQPEMSKPIFGGTKTLPATTGVVKAEHSF